MYMPYENQRELPVLIGQVLAEVTATGDRIDFKTTDGKQYCMLHNQDCCESVSIESIVGDLNDLIGEPILVAEEVSSEGEPPPASEGSEWGGPESFTWTFYKLATRKGYVDIRWYGSSNGYYSESVDFYEILPEA
ncbi:hypothetical protein [Achromobacter spanius]|nr:hypothetical protein [Achromobacter spanius]